MTAPVIRLFNPHLGIVEEFKMDGFTHPGCCDCVAGSVGNHCADHFEAGIEETCPTADDNAAYDAALVELDAWYAAEAGIAAAEHRAECETGDCGLCEELDAKYDALVEKPRFAPDPAPEHHYGGWVHLAAFGALPTFTRHSGAYAYLPNRLR